MPAGISPSPGCAFGGHGDRPSLSQVSAGHILPPVLLTYHQGLLFLTNLISFLAWLGRTCLCYGVKVPWLPELPVAGGLPWQGHPSEGFGRTRGFIPVLRQSRLELKGQRRSAFQFAARQRYLAGPGGWGVVVRDLANWMR